MRWRRLVFAVILGMAFYGPGARAQVIHRPNTLKAATGASSPRARIGDLAWLAGRWTGDFMGGTAEEVFAPPQGDTMIGMFRLVKDGRIVFSELIDIVEEEGSLVLKLKHFDRELKGWEEKDVARVFPLVRRTETEAYFDSITYRRDGDGMRFFVAVRQKNGELQEMESRHRRAPLN
jgi:hypothetical protein